MIFRGRMEFDSLPMSPFNGTFDIGGTMKKLKGIDYYNTKDVKVNLIIDNVSINAEGLSRQTNEMLNENSEMVAAAVTPVLEKMVEKAYVS
ncbi:hypothetical protein ILUMI_21363 [Ignelater luminosus]|uniref:Uncharacterized protein n=1 Tax=Ignelater luminosus TaxID=2038154 RepID=A0A8K0CJ26_IGNLU|nr:hypothetical protein ILUMI_21363 [Ignelater luminosus]